ncbi:hypothetical protein AB6A23_26435 [Paenibacillus tarimensis]
MNTAANYKKCKKYMNRVVEIKTVRGVYRGKIVKVDKKRVYLIPLHKKTGSKASISFVPFILPLVLFDLLVIALLETKPRFKPFY